MKKSNLKNITSKKIAIHRYRATISQALKASGYTYRSDKNDYILNDETGRFHVKPSEESKNKEAFIHYDLNIDNKHTVFAMPYRLDREIGRIKWNIRHARIPQKEFEAKVEYFKNKKERYEQYLQRKADKKK